MMLTWYPCLIKYMMKLIPLSEKWESEILMQNSLILKSDPMLKNESIWLTKSNLFKV